MVDNGWIAVPAAIPIDEPFAGPVIVLQLLGAKRNLEQKSRVSLRIGLRIDRQNPDSAIPAGWIKPNGTVRPHSEDSEHMDSGTTFGVVEHFLCGTTGSAQKCGLPPHSLCLASRR